MAVQNRSNLINNPFILSGVSYVKNAITLAQDAARAAVLAVFTVMAKVAATIPTTMTADVGNTGDGTVTAVAAIAGGSPVIGTWELELIAVIAHGGIFKLTDPNGNIVDSNITLNPGAGLATVFTVAGMTFTITDGAADFVLADLFTMAVTADGTWVPWAVDGVGGAEVPLGILLVDSVTAAALVAADVTGQSVLVGGCLTVDSSQVILDDGVSTLATVLPGGKTIAETLELSGIFTEGTVDIAGYENS